MLTPPQSSLVNNDNISLINEDSPLIKALRTAELRKIIVDNLNPSIVDITALAATCTVATACAKHDFVRIAPPSPVLEHSLLTRTTGILGLQLG